MRLDLNLEVGDLEKLGSFVASQQGRVVVRQREIRNVSGELPPNSRDDMWRTMVMCLLTSQQRSGPGSFITSFLLSDPFPISLENCLEHHNVASFVSQQFSAYRGIRFVPTISERLQKNLQILRKEDWKTLEDFRNRLVVQRQSQPVPMHYKLEREAASYVNKAFIGFGSKQSRNFWQSLGLSRYESVLDSRVIRWLRGFGFPLPVSSAALSEEDYYCYISDLLRDWCIKANILPCMFDAAIFASFDDQEWPENAVFY